MSQLIRGRTAIGQNQVMSGEAKEKNSDGVSHLSKWRCPGVFREIEFKNCPECGAEVEFFPQDQARPCPACGALVTRASSSCLSHCPARQSDCYREYVRRQALEQISDEADRTRVTCHNETQATKK